MVSNCVSCVCVIVVFVIEVFVVVMFVMVMFVLHGVKVRMKKKCNSGNVVGDNNVADMSEYIGDIVYHYWMWHVHAVDLLWWTIFFSVCFCNPKELSMHAHSFSLSHTFLCIPAPAPSPVSGWVTVTHTILMITIAKNVSASFCSLFSLAWLTKFEFAALSLVKFVMSYLTALQLSTGGCSLLVTTLFSLTTKANSMFLRVPLLWALLCLTPTSGGLWPK